MLIAIFLQFVFVTFNRYTRPETTAWEGIDLSWAPIVPPVTQWETKGGANLTYTQLPLILAGYVKSGPDTGC